jgi:catechol 2,3-dioxygenase-like lactoylglutathione lyase family enzyme
MNQADARKAKLIGINHVALEVGDIQQALDYYGNLFSFTLRGRGKGMAFIDLGDQFLALAESDQLSRDRHRHFGLVVDDRSMLKTKLEQLDAELLPGKGLNFLDPWGNFFQIVEYRDIQFSKTSQVLNGMGLAGLKKSDEALDQLKEKGMG